MFFRHRRLFRERKQIRIDHPATSKPGPRWGYGRPVHGPIQEVLARRRPEYRALVETLLTHLDGFLALPEDFAGGEWFAGLDAFLSYSLLAERKPRRYVEVGSGRSTRIANHARRDHGFEMEITSIDPNPRSAIDTLCDRVARQPLEEVDLESLPVLEAGDVFFFDGSHRCFQNSDVTVFLLDVLPRLAPGVIVHLHDIFWPLDYPPEWTLFWFSEQYLLGTMLLTADPGFDTLLPARFLTGDAELKAVLRPLEERLPRGYGLESSFWLVKT